MWDMCQMLNIWHISHTKPNLSPFSICEIWYFFCNIKQYHYKFATVRKKCGILFIVCLFLSLSFLRQSHLSHPNPLLSLSPQSSLLFHTHADVDADLSLAMVFFFFFCCGLMGSVLIEVGGFGWARLWCQQRCQQRCQQTNP